METGRWSRVLLEDSLRPVSMFLRYNGVLFDFLTANRGNCLLYKARCFFSGFIMLLLWSSAALLSIKCFVLFDAKGNFDFQFQLLIKIIFWRFAVVLLSAIIPQYQYSIGNQQLQQFFSSWKKVEMQSPAYLKSTKPRKKNRAIQTLHIMNSLIVIGGPITCCYCFYLYTTLPEDHCFPISFLETEAVLPFMAIFMGISIYFAHTYVFFGETVPTGFFYHAGCDIEDLAHQVQHTAGLLFSSNIVIDPVTDAHTNPQLGKARPLRRIQRRYQTVLHWVNRANQLFGTSILSFQLLSLFNQILLLYFAIKIYNNSCIMSLICLCLGVMEVYRTVLINQLMSHLYLSRGKLQSAIAGLLSADWYRLPDEDRNLLVSFHARLDREDLAACPLNLFTVNPTNLLTMLSLVVTYMVVIFQTDAADRVVDDASAQSN